MKLMGGEIKNLFFNFIWTKKQLILAVLFFVFLGLAFPLQFAQAGVVSGILGALMAIPTAIITLILQLVLLVTNLFVSIAGVILWWVLSPYFMSLSYTHGGIVDVGWPIVRDFINMFFIIALVIIGLATALRIKEYQVQKTLPTLIIIAILINFTPVICGLIVDASNIIMNFFLEELTGLRIMVTVFSTQGSLLVEMFSHPFDIRYASAALGKTIGLIAFGGIATFVFLLYSVLFIMRYIMIWVLVIVSPIAFFSRIFPATKRGEYAFKSILSWDEWWKQFIEWSLIGITAGFFLYLGEQLMVMAPGFIPGVYPEGVGGMLATPIIDFMNNLLPYGVVLAFLLLGFFVATSTSALGAVGITKLAKRGAIAMRKEAAKMGWEGAKRGGRITGRGIKAGAIATGKAIRHPKETFAALKGYAIRAPGAVKGAVKGAGEAMRTREFWKETVPTKIKTGAGLVKKGLKAALWEYDTGRKTKGGKPIKEPGILKAGLEPFRKEIFGLRKGERPERPKKAPEETDEEFEARLETYDAEMERQGEERVVPGAGVVPGAAATPVGGAAPPEEERERVQKQIANLEKEIVKPYPESSQAERERLREVQKENLEKLKTKLEELKPVKESIIPKYLDLRRKIGDIHRKIEGKPEEETLKERELEDALKKEADEIWGTIKKDETLYKKWEETGRGWRRPPRGGRPPGPPRKEGPPSRTPPSKPLKPVTPAAASTPKPTEAPPQPKAQPRIEEVYPIEVLERQVRKHLEKIKKEGGTPFLCPPYLTVYLRQKGVSKEEISKMEDHPEDAWLKAEELLKAATAAKPTPPAPEISPETPPPSPAAREIRGGTPKREYRRLKKQKKKRRGEKGEGEEY